MKNLVNYINENKRASITDLIYEANFHAEDLLIANLDPKMQDVAKFKLLVKKWDALGEEQEYDDNEHFAGNNFQRLESRFKNDDGHANDKKKVKEAEKNFSQLWDVNKMDEKDKIKLSVKIYGAYIDAFYSWAKKYATSGRGYDKYIDSSFIATTFLGLGSWIITYGIKPEVQDILLGKLIKKFDKDMGKINGVEGLSTFLKLYDEKKASMKHALEVETATLKSIDDLEQERKEHKYTIFGGSTEGSCEIKFFDNSKFDSFKDIFDSKPIEGDKNGVKFLAWTQYDLDKCLRNIVNSKEIPGCFLCSGYYTYDNKDPENIIPRFGFIDELPEKIYKYSSYDKKFFYRGKLHEESYGYRFADSLWNQPNED